MSTRALNQITISSLVILLLYVISGSIANKCRCVPNQWEGILSSVDREFDLKGGRTGTSENEIYVHYDYINRKFAMTDLTTGNKAIADYRKGFKYVVRPEGCRGIKTEERMRKMCLPDNAEFMGQFNLGTDIAVDMWEFSGPYNVTMKTTVVTKNCVPLSEEIYMAKGAYASLTSSMYLEVKLGAQDTSIFDPPVSCIADIENGVDRNSNETPTGKHPGMKRANENPWDLLKSLRSRLYN